MRTRRFCFPMLLLLFMPIARLAGDELLPVPKYAEQNKADHQLRDKHSAEFHDRDPVARVAFAHKLQELADAENDPAAKFVMLREARECAVDGGDLVYCMAIVDDIAKTYAINAREMKASALSEGFDKSAVSQAELYAQYLKVTDDALAVWDCDMANKTSWLARKLVHGNPARLAEVDARDKMIRFRNHELREAIAAAARLEKDPDDAKANQTLGRHLCFNMDRWADGLAMLVKGSPGDLQELAKLDESHSTDAATMLKLAERWWTFKDDKLKLPAGAGKQRAIYWYQQALPKLSGEQKTLAEQRIAGAGTAK